MNISIHGIPYPAHRQQVIKDLANVLHNTAFLLLSFGHPADPSLLNFDVQIKAQKAKRHERSGTLTLPTEPIGRKFLDWVKDHPVEMARDTGTITKLKFSRPTTCPAPAAIKLQREPFLDPDIDIAYQLILQNLQHHIRVDTVQFGVFYHSRDKAQWPSKSREFSVEWEHDYLTDSQSAWLHFDYDKKSICIMVYIQLFDL